MQNELATVGAFNGRISSVPFGYGIGSKKLDSGSI